MVETNYLSQLLTDYKTRKGIGDSELADELGVTTRCVRYWIAGNPPTRINLDKIYDCVGFKRGMTPDRPTYDTLLEDIRDYDRLVSCYRERVGEDTFNSILAVSLVSNVLNTDLLERHVPSSLKSDGEDAFIIKPLSEGLENTSIYVSGVVCDIQVTVSDPALNKTFTHAVNNGILNKIIVDLRKIINECKFHGQSISR